MSGVSVIRYLLANASGVIAVVPAARIFRGGIPVGTTLPAIGVREVSGVKLTGIRTNEAGRLKRERVQVTVYATSYPEQKSILALATSACPSQRGTVNSVSVDSIVPDLEGPDLEQPDAGIYEQSQDFIVLWAP